MFSDNLGEEFDGSDFGLNAGRILFIGFDTALLGSKQGKCPFSRKT